MANFADMSTHLKTSFPPITSPEIEILILGSIPGDRSIAENEYYGHPRNRFWQLLARLTNSETPENYSDKKHLLLQNRIALWDVAHKANRKGSLDSAIKNAEPNDIQDFIVRHPDLKTIGYNGLKAEALYDRFFERKAEINYYSLPSTSPANAGCSIDQLFHRWRVLFSPQLKSSQ